ncbi:MAG: DUF4281 domain-containing protein [Pyrinomonadaceae bacterium]|nr:DUF4281 domain-containing protein [Pyrinomonadaceae bacterium]
MQTETIFQIVNTIALLAWILLIVAPRWTWTRRIVISGGVPILLSVAYLTLFVVFFGKTDGDFGSLAGVMKLFSDENVVLTAWIHYLVFDLFVGSWEVRDAQENNISHWFVVPCLVLTFLFGPIGFLLYHIIRFAVLRSRAEKSDVRTA